MLDINLIAAKSDRENPILWLPFSIHSSDTAEIMERLFHHWLPDSVKRIISDSLAGGFDSESRDDITVNYCRLLAFLHDIGKLTPAFQYKIAPHISGYSEKMINSGIDLSGGDLFTDFPHTVAGEAVLLKAGFPQSICEIVGFHHGKHTGIHFDRDSDYPHPQCFYGYRRCNQKEWSQLREQWIQYALKETHFSVDNLPKPNVQSQMLLTGMLIMADWIASNTDYFPYISVNNTIDDPSSRIEIAWERLALPDVWYPDAGSSDHEWFRSRFGFIPNIVQKHMTKIVSDNPNAGIYVLEAPMGVGKTEAALASAEIMAQKLGAGGVYFGLPTQATANGLFGRICQWAAKSDTEVHSIRLAHGMVDLNDEYRSIFHGTAADSGDETVIVHEWFEGRKQALLSDFVIATVDQFLLASLKQKHNMLRHLGLAGKIVIIDECHAYDAYMNVYLDHTLRWMGAYGVPVIILSATLPPMRRDELIRAYLGLRKQKELDIQKASIPYAYPVLTWTSSENVYQQAIPVETAQRRIAVKRLHESELVQDLSEVLYDGGCAAVIVNTVADAQRLSQLLAERMQGYEIICFHSRFIATDRADIEKSLLSCVGKNSKEADRDKLIVVGTQVMEQSLDVDFDYMITELCPMDLLLQRSGRLHRHERKRGDKLCQPVLAILDTYQPNDKIYDAWIMTQTDQNLPDMLVIPDCIPKLVSSVYNAADDHSPLYQQYKQSISAKENKASRYCINARLLRNRRRNLLSDYLDDDIGPSKEAEASVRDTDDTIEVLVLQKTESHMLSLVSGAASYDPTLPITESDAMIIARERLRLPFFYSKYHFSETIHELDVMPSKWRESAWLKGEMLLLLDQNADAILLGKKLHYSRQYGLSAQEKG